MFVTFFDLLNTDNQGKSGVNGEQHSISPDTQAISGPADQCPNLGNIGPSAQRVHRIGYVALLGGREFPRLPESFCRPFYTVHKSLYENIRIMSRLLMISSFHNEDYFASH
jgi:hypothetical protein